MRILIVGSGVIGISVAYYAVGKFPDAEIVVIGRDMPGIDGGNTNWVPGDWASPFAGALYCPTMTTDKLAQEMQQESYKLFWRIYHQDSSSGIQQRKLRQYWDETIVSGQLEERDKILWARGFIHGYKKLSEEELPTNRRGITGGAEFDSFAINPEYYLPWLRRECEQRGVKFEQREISDIRKCPDADFVINATGAGAYRLVGDDNVETVRGQTAWVESDYSGPICIREGKEYTYVIPRLFSNGVISGGVSDRDSDSTKPDMSTRADIFKRVADLNPDFIKNAKRQPRRDDRILDKPTGIQLIKDIVGFRPGRVGGPRIEKDSKISKLIHVYGFEGAGYIFSGGAAKRAVDFINPKSKL